MRKKIAALLTGCLLLQSFTGFAAPVQKAYAKNADAGIFSEVQPAKVLTSGRKAARNSAGSLEIEVHPLLGYTGKVTIECNGETRELDFTNNSASLMAGFKNVVPGNHVVTVKAEKFAVYTQNVMVEAGWAHKLLLCAAKMETKEGAALGWLQAGDVNGDGMVNREDTEGLLNLIHDNTANRNYDLNNDGKTDIADLQMLVQNIGEKPQESLVEKQWMSLGVAPAGSTSTLGGDASALLENKSITLTPAAQGEISESNPVGLEFVLAGDGADIPEIGGMRILSPFVQEDGMTVSDIVTGEAVLELGNGQTETFSLRSQGSARKAGAASLKTEAKAASVKTESDGSLVLDFGGQIAVKRVTIQITGTRKDKKLAEIAKVEFVNNMEQRIPAPELSIPVLSAPKSGNEQLSVSWTAQSNVTGYELFIEGPAGKSGKVMNDTVRVSGNGCIVSSIQTAPLLNFETYKVKVRSVNGDWKSPWSEEKTGIPAPQAKPASPDNVKVTAGRNFLHVTWKDMDDASGYMVYYKKNREAGNNYEPAVAGFVADEKTGGTGMIRENSFRIENLEEDTEYSVYVTGWNALGWGSPSLKSVGKTKNSNPPVLPNYKLLNTSLGEGKVSAHIVSADFGGSGGAKMVDSPLDTKEKSALGLVDNNYNSYWVKNDWDDGVAYPANDKGINITLDASYKMNFLAFAAYDETLSLSTVRVDYWNANDDMKQSVGARLLRKLDGNENPYYIVKFDSAVTADKIRICIGTGYTRGDMKIGEVRFYHYDSLEDEIMGLYADEMHSTLRSDVAAGTIDALEKRLEQPDKDSGEKHPLYSELKLELDTARDILANKPSPAYEVLNQITGRKDSHLGFGGLNPWQPLGKTVYAGETLVVYVGHNTKRTGDSTNLNLVMTQYHAESGSLAKSTAALKVGRNEITVPQVADKDFERGGQLYIAYSGNNASDKYAVRVLGGSDIPVLNLYGKTGTERTNAIRTYIDSLEKYTASLGAEHEKVHKNGAKAVNYDYDQKNCILNATDIMMEKMMYSLPATKVWEPLSSKDDKVRALDVSLQAMEDTMDLFYQHKGLSASAGTERGNNALPSQHLNIRYMRMFAGAFMYASGNHIGIEWNSTGLAGGAAGMQSLGWGIAHEIGHDINQGTYAVAEVTNNYFAQLLTGKERYTYENVYKKVTSGTAGRDSNVFTQLAMYWQLHLAFDDNKDDHAVYENYEDQFNNLFFARVDTYARNPEKAPVEGLVLDGGADQNLMRLACAAANKNILPFFERWGITADKATAVYAEKYGKPYEKALYYIDKGARDYRVEHPGEPGTVKGREVITKAEASAVSNRVQVTIDTKEDAGLILGYEIIRSMTENGVTRSKVAGFQPVNKDGGQTVFTDTIATINNRVMSYSVKAVDRFLNYSAAADAGQVKIQTDGVMDKSLWTVSTNLSSPDDTETEMDDDDPDSGYDGENPESVAAKKEHTVDRVIDNDQTTVYHGTAPEAGSAEITIDLHEVKEVTALKYSGSLLSSAKVEISADGNTWTVVKEVTGLDGTAKQADVWFDSVNESERDKWIGTYDARYVRLTTSQTDVTIREIDICGPSGDNMEFMQSDSGKQSIGVLKNNYQYSDKAEDVIPAGSLIFTGTYKGNPAYNVVMLYDTAGNVIGAKDGSVKAGQVIFADVPKNGNLGETSEGIWVYYVEPGQWDAESLKAVKGVRGELYRVDNAKTLEGERITSDTPVVQIPETLPDITLAGKVSGQ